jgi:hypothetical protein
MVISQLVNLDCAFICNWPSHKRATCPMLSKLAQSDTSATRNFACAVEPRVSDAANALYTRSQMNDSGKLQSSVCRADEQQTAACDTDCKKVLSSVPVSRSCVQPADTVNVQSQTYYRSARVTVSGTMGTHATVSDTIIETNPMSSYTRHKQTDLCGNGVVIEGLSKLHYLPVTIHGINGIL